MKGRRSTETVLTHAGTRWEQSTGSVSMPVYHTATFRHPESGKSTGYDYSRSGNLCQVGMANLSKARGMLHL
jgi:cystathionine beta-lyase/cystathionine gamma-synthase